MNETPCFIANSDSLPCQLLQISVSEDEISRRIQCFVEKKRNEIDLCNIMDFTDIIQRTEENSDQASISQHNANVEDKSMTCARVNSNVVKQAHSKCHLRVKRVENNVGPQTQPDYLNTLEKLMFPTGLKSEETHFHTQNKGNNNGGYFEKSNMFKYGAIVERLENIEEYLDIPESKVKHIYQRLKAIEDRLLYLESVSPEYTHFLREKFGDRCSAGASDSLKDIPTGSSVYERKLYSASEMDAIIHKLEERNIDQKPNIIDQK